MCGHPPPSALHLRECQESNLEREAAQHLFARVSVFLSVLSGVEVMKVRRGRKLFRGTKKKFLPGWGQEV